MSVGLNPHEYTQLQFCEQQARHSLTDNTEEGLYSDGAAMAGIGQP